MLATVAPVLERIVDFNHLLGIVARIALQFFGVQNRPAVQREPKSL